MADAMRRGHGGKGKKLSKPPAYVPDPVYLLVTGCYKKRKTKAKKNVIPMAKRKHHTEAMAAKAKAALTPTTSTLTDSEKLDKAMAAIEKKFLRDNEERALEFAKLQHVDKMTPEQAIDAHTTFGTHMLVNGVQAALDFEV